jgi:cell wall-associated NlpC family hydrolase
VAIWAVATPAPVVLVVAAFSGGGASASASTGGFGTGLRKGTVPAAYEQLVIAAGKACPAAPASIIAAQLEQESAWKPDVISSAGAAGIAQFLPSTWTSWSAPGQSPFDPVAAIPAQAKYDCSLAKQVTEWQQAGKLPATLDVTSLMLAAYNAGPYAVLAADGIPQNGETPAYVTRITSRASHYADSTGVLPGGPISGFAAKLIGFAQDQLDQPYAWAGGTYTGPSQGVCDAGNGASNDCTVIGFDCSGLILFAAYQASAGKIQLPHSADAQTRTGKPINRANIRPGDIISFTDPGERVAHHIGIYLGNNTMINAPESGSDVRTDDLTSSYYRSQEWRIVRFG